jgi:glutathione S-transferase
MKPKSNIPTLLRDDGTALTEFQAIAYWLARTNPRAKLLPGDPDGDAALFYVEFWADKTGIELPPNCLAHHQRIRARPAVYRVLREEGYR